MFVGPDTDLRDPTPLVELIIEIGRCIEHSVPLHDFEIYFDRSIRDTEHFKARLEGLLKRAYRRMSRYEYRDYYTQARDQVQRAISRNLECIQ